MERLSDTADHVLVSVNPKAGSGSRRQDVDELVARLDGHGLCAEVSTDLDDVVERAGRWLADGRLRAVVGAGGDGTMHQLLNRMPPNAPLAMLPLGTENLLAKYHRQRRGAGPLAEMLVAGQVTKFDTGRANDRLFLLMASAGFDAEVARRMAEGRGQNISHLSYATPIFSAVWHYDYAPMNIVCETPDGEQQIEATFCFVFNLPRYGLGLPFAPEADGTDGLLDVCTFRRGSFYHGLRYLVAVALNRHHRLEDCTKLQVHRMKIESDGRVPYQLDGDPGGWLPLEIDVVRQRATLIVPAPRE
jgi:diacylglycerol kinase family enzyme